MAPRTGEPSSFAGGAAIPRPPRAAPPPPLGVGGTARAAARRGTTRLLGPLCAAALLSAGSLAPSYLGASVVLPSVAPGAEGGTGELTAASGAAAAAAADRGRRRPSVPLREECLDVVRRAGPPVDLAYEDVTGGHVDHPHLGATYEDGTTFGYVPDVGALRRDPPPFRLGGGGDGEEALLARACSTRDSDNKVLTEKVFVDLSASAATWPNEGGPGGPGPTPPPPVRILCLVYTIEPHHSRLPAIRETWGQRCDGFLAASNKTDASVGAVNIPHSGLEIYRNMWQKVRSIWSYVYDHFYDKYDWFHIGGDDMYVIVDNLRLYLESDEIRAAANGGEYLPDGTEEAQVPLYLGRRYALRGDMENLFNSGGPGYTLNRAALKVLVAWGMPHHYVDARASGEDVKVAQVLRHFGVFPYETKDETGAERYMPWMPGTHYEYKIGSNDGNYDLYGIGIKEGMDCCSARSVAFHYASPDAMRRMHALLYGHCPAPEAAASSKL